MNDQDFASRLLASAKSDGPNAEQVQTAYAAFMATSGAPAEVPTSTAAAPKPAPMPTAAPLQAPLAATMSRSLAAKLLTIGAIAGSLLTYGVTARMHAPPALATALAPSALPSAISPTAQFGSSVGAATLPESNSSAATLLAQAGTAAPIRVQHAPSSHAQIDNAQSVLHAQATAISATATSVTATDSLDDPMRAAARESRTEAAVIAPAPTQQDPQAEAAAHIAASRLRAEIAALDRANTAARQQQYAQVLDHIQHYRTEFPAGELARDADVLAIEALRAKGDHVAAQAAANAFLAKYAADPHAARVRKAR
jgi:hypothetical protein